MWHLTNSEAVILGVLAALVLALALWRDR